MKCCHFALACWYCSLKCCLPSHKKKKKESPKHSFIATWKSWHPKKMTVKTRYYSTYSVMQQWGQRIEKWVKISLKSVTKITRLGRNQWHTFSRERLSDLIVINENMMAAIRARTAPKWLRTWVFKTTYRSPHSTAQGQAPLFFRRPYWRCWLFRRGTCPAALLVQRGCGVSDGHTLLVAPYNKCQGAPEEIALWRHRHRCPPANNTHKKRTTSASSF